MNGDVVVRRATQDDYDSVINIIDDLWDGYDYLPTLYHSLLQSTNHVFYVAELNNKVVNTNTSIFFKYKQGRLSNFIGIFHVFFCVLDYLIKLLC